MGEAALKRITVDEFLAYHGEGDTRYELFGGEIVAMAPPSLYHAAIAGAATFLIGRGLKPPCRVLQEVGVKLPWRNDTYYQADLAVTCAPVVRGEWGVSEPIVLVEVLSPSTEAQDRTVKLVDYRHISSVQAIVLISSEARRVEFWRRTDDAWTVVDLEVDDSIALDFLGFDIPVEALYDGLDFSQGAVAQT